MPGKFSSSKSKTGVITSALAVFVEKLKASANRLPCLRHRISAGVRSISGASLVGSLSSNNSQEFEPKADKPRVMPCHSVASFAQTQGLIFIAQATQKSVIALP